MANFFDINSSQFSKKTPDGTEKIQISANQFALLKDIANLASKLNGLEITDFKDASTYVDYNKVGEFVPFKAVRATNGPSEIGSNYGSVGFFTVININTTDNIKSIFIILFSEQITSDSPLTVSSGTVSIGASSTTIQWKSLKQDVTLTGFAEQSSFNGDLPFPINSNTSLVQALIMIYYTLSNGNIKILSGSASGGDNDYIGIIANNGINGWCGYLFSLSTGELYLNYSMDMNAIDQLNDAGIIQYIIDNYDSYYDLGYINQVANKSNSLFESILSSSSTTLSMIGGRSYSYKPTTAKTITVTISTAFPSNSEISMLIVPYNTTVNFSAGSGITLHKHQDMDSISPTSGFKVYTVVAAASNRKEFFINCAPYT